MTQLTVLSGPAETVPQARAALLADGWKVLAGERTCGQEEFDGEAFLTVATREADCVLAVEPLGWRHRGSLAEAGFALRAVAVPAGMAYGENGVPA